MSDFRELKVWQKAHSLALNTHRIAGKMRGSSNSGLRMQTIRAAMSVPQISWKVEGSSLAARHAVIYA
jgi:four helix bundle protein